MAGYVNPAKGTKRGRRGRSVRAAGPISCSLFVKTDRITDRVRRARAIFVCLTPRKNPAMKIVFLPPGPAPVRHARSARIVPFTTPETARAPWQNPDSARNGSPALLPPGEGLYRPPHDV